MLSLGLGVSGATAQNSGQSTENSQDSSTAGKSQTQTSADPAQLQQAQQAQPPAAPKIAVERKEVTVYATVRDKKGNLVANLTKSDFAIDEEGRPQTIQYFAHQADLPLTLGFLVDTSLSVRNVLGEERSATSTFIDHMLRSEKDKAFLIHFDFQVELLQDMTPSKQKLQAALGELETPELQRASNGGGHHGHSGGGTLLYDAIYLASNELMRKQQGRKAIIVLTDGVDHGSKESLESAIESAQRADTAVYSILFAGEEDHPFQGAHAGHGGGGWGTGYPGGQPRQYPPPQREDHPDGKKVLERLSRETGGRMFQVSKKLSIEQIYAQIEEEQRGLYTMAYTPTPPDTEPGYHKIHVVANQKDLVVQARDGYYSEK
jgi:VWFA-related protein